MKDDNLKQNIATVLALPIGNVSDLSLRAKQVLESSAFLLCEDTRKARDFFRRANLKFEGKLISWPAFKEREFRDWTELFNKTLTHSSFTIVSDAGTPIVNDPGLALITAARDHGYKIDFVPGPSAPIAAWQWSGGFGLPFVFGGFVPKNSKRKFFETLSWAKTFVCFESRHEILKTFNVLKQNPERRMWIAREMTKTHQELIGDDVESCFQRIEYLLKQDQGVGELTLVVEGDQKESDDSIDPGKIFGENFEDLKRFRNAPPKEAAKIAATWSGKKTSEMYKVIFE